MNDLWLIPELLLSVLDHLSRDDQTKMARVCRAFWTTTIPRIWHTLPISAENSHLKSFMDFTTPDPPTLNKRFELHAALVHKLSLTLYDEGRVDAALAGLNSPVFKSLYSLTIEMPETSTSAERLDDLLSTLIHPSLRHFEFTSQVDGLNLDEYTAAIASRIRNNTGLLEVLSLEQASDMPPRVQELCAEAISHNPLLREVKVGDTSGDYQVMFRAAGTLRQLVRCAFYGDWLRSADPKVEYIDGSFTSLRIWKGDIACLYIPNLLQSLPAKQLEEMTLQSISKSDLVHDNLASHITQFSALKLFDLALDTQDPLWAAILNPILSCSKLETVAICTPVVPGELTDDMLKSIAQAWRSLKSLDVQGGNRGGRPVRPSATLCGLVYFAELSPNLENLVVNVDASHDLRTEVNPALSAKKKLEVTIITWSPNGGVEQERILEVISNLWKNRTWVDPCPPKKGRGTTFALEGTLI